jgi:MerR family transcriptional regulator, light-induced transcriptional regulator
MSDLRSRSMGEVAYDVGSGLPDCGHEVLGFSVARSLEREKGRATVKRAVEFEVVPRLLLAHPSGSSFGPSLNLDFPSEITAFAETVLGCSEDAAGAHIQGLHDQGVSLETIYLKLIAPAARYLKYQWLEDERDFAEVTLALCRLQQLLRHFSTAFRGNHQQVTGLRALLTAGPSEPHDLGYPVFGLVLLGEFFRRDGWDAWIEPAPKAGELSTLIHNEWFDVVELMVSGEKRLDELAASIKAIRKASLNKSLGVLVCGQTFVEHPELVLLVGGDGPAADPRDAASQAEKLVRMIASRE